MSEPVRLLVFGIAMPLGAIVALQAAWAGLRLMVSTPSSTMLRLIAARLTSTINAGNDPAAALLGLQIQMRWPYPRRIRRAAAALDCQRPSTLVAALLAARLLPKELAESGRCAEASGPVALARFFAEVAGPRRKSSSPWTAVAPYLGVLLAAAGVLAFVTVMIMPKFEVIFKDLGLALPARTAVLLNACRNAGRFWPILLVVGMGVGCGIAAGFRWIAWRRMARRARALTVLAGVADGTSEATLAARLAFGGPTTRAALATAGMAGDFPGLCRACGWRASTPGALAAKLAAYDARGRWLGQMAAIALQILTPVVVAIPVWLIVTGIFAALIAILTALESQL